MKKLFLTLTFVLLCACARPTQAPMPPGDADALWTKMAAVPGASKMQFSLRFGTEGDTRRVTGLIWGDADAIRMDIMAGIGAPIAKIWAQGRDFLLYAPQKLTAYTYSGDASPLFKVGVPIPLTVKQLYLLLNGNFAAVFHPSGNAKADGENFVFPVEQGGSITINGQGQAIAWNDVPGGWKLQASYDTAASTAPKSIRLNNVKGQYAIILITDREAVHTFASDQLTLQLPTGTKKLPLADLQKGKINF